MTGVQGVVAGPGPTRFGRRQTPRRRRRGSRGNAPAAPSSTAQEMCSRQVHVQSVGGVQGGAGGSHRQNGHVLRPSGRPMTAPCAPGPPGVSRASSPLPELRAAPIRICCFAAAGCSSTSGVQGRRRSGDTRPDRRCLGCCLGWCPGLTLVCSCTSRPHEHRPVLAKKPRQRP